jgi:subtilisin family serine protease
MCDFFFGRLILSHHKDDLAAANLIADIVASSIEHVTYITSMEDELTLRNATVPDNFSYRLHLLQVPEGQEVWKINYLRFFYQHKILEALASDQSGGVLSAISSTESHMLVEPDSVLSLAQSPTSVNFSFEEIHTRYREILGLPYPLSTGAGSLVAIIDTGLDPNTGIAADPLSRNYHDRNDTKDTQDREGHGTVVASIIHDIAPESKLLILKVGDRNPISEWNVLAALLGAADSDVINMSLAFGMPFRDCPQCGRSQTHSSRSAVFEQTVSEIRRTKPQTVMVAAMGNRKKDQPDFPARFADVVSVGAIDSNLKRASYSNYGAVNELGKPHQNVFFAPGGADEEFVATTTVAQRVSRYQGTSFAAPYVSGLFALYFGREPDHPNRDAALSYFRARSRKTSEFPGYSETEFGNGLIQLT